MPDKVLKDDKATRIAFFILRRGLKWMRNYNARQCA